MIDLRKLQKWVEAINTYYGFALLVYAAILYIASHNRFFMWVLVVTTPLLTGWTGYLLKSFIEQRNQRHGFSVLSSSMSYEIGNNHKYALRYSIKVKASTNHVMVYPIGYQWTGMGEEAMPKVTGRGQQLLAIVDSYDSKDKAAPYKATSTEGEWHYWFIALNPPIHKGETIDIKYSQEFHDKKGFARPELYYFVRTPMKSLELKVKFSVNALPATVTGTYTKLSDPSRPYQKTGVHYDPDTQWATWVIEQPKRGYCYRIYWE